MFKKKINTKTTIIPISHEHSSQELEERTEFFRYNLNTQRTAEEKIETDKNLSTESLELRSLYSEDFTSATAPIKSSKRKHEMFEESLQKIEENERLKKTIICGANIIGKTFTEASDIVQPIILYPYEIDGQIIGYSTGYNPNIYNVTVKNKKIIDIIGLELDSESDSSSGYI